ncbi:hypothetical protein [Rhodococcus erythropolis]|nr:hypothetical protein [Rhodococcus erythropolis]MDF2470065.1 hypothetical protein [Rhodococcus erythropolis]
MAICYCVVGILLADATAGITIEAGTAVVFRFVLRTIITGK